MGFVWWLFCLEVSTPVFLGFGFPQVMAVNLWTMTTTEIGNARQVQSRCSGQIIATSHDLTPNGGWAREIPLFQGNLGWWNIIVWPDCWLAKALLKTTKHLQFSGVILLPGSFILLTRLWWEHDLTRNIYLRSLKGFGLAIVIHVLGTHSERSFSGASLGHDLLSPCQKKSPPGWHDIWKASQILKEKKNDSFARIPSWEGRPAKLWYNLSVQPLRCNFAFKNPCERANGAFLRRNGMENPCFSMITTFMFCLMCSEDRICDGIVCNIPF